MADVMLVFQNCFKAVAPETAIFKMVRARWAPCSGCCVLCVLRVSCVCCKGELSRRAPMCYSVVQAKDLRHYFVSDYRKLVGALPPAAEAGLDEIWEEDDTVSGRVTEADVAFMLGTRNFNAFPVNVKVRARCHSWQKSSAVPCAWSTAGVCHGALGCLRVAVGGADRPPSLAVRCHE